MFEQAVATTTTEHTIGSSPNHLTLTVTTTGYGPNPLVSISLHPGPGFNGEAAVFGTPRVAGTKVPEGDNLHEFTSPGAVTYAAHGSRELHTLRMALAVASAELDALLGYAGP